MFDRYCFSFPVQCCTLSVLINPLAHSPMLFLHYICCSYYQDAAVENFRSARCLMHAKRRVALHPCFCFACFPVTLMAAPCRISQSLWERRVEKLQMCGASTWSKNLVLAQNQICVSGVRLGGSWGGSTQGFLKLF